MNFSKSSTQLTDYQGSLFRRFTGKEKDSESGYYYFGARYFMPNLSIWNSVDPMTDKYPSLSPYNYCAWNPVKLVDPKGEEIWKPEILKGGIVNYIAETGDDASTLQKQYNLNKGDASYLFGKMKNGKISGATIRERLGSDILKFRFNAKFSNRGEWNKKAVYHLGFAMLYNHTLKNDAPFQLKDFFDGMPEETGSHCNIPQWSSWGRMFDPHNNIQLAIPALGGGDIPITFAESVASSKTLLKYSGMSYKANNTYQLRFDVYSTVPNHHPLQKIMMNVLPKYEERTRLSYGD